MQKVKSWKTTASGAALVLSGLSQAWLEYSNGQGINWGVILPQVITGVGLIMAKDHDATHSGLVGGGAAVPQPGHQSTNNEVKQ